MPETTLLEIALNNYRKLKHTEKHLIDQLLVLNTRKEKAGGSIARMPENPRNNDERITENMMYSDPLEKELQTTQTLLGIADKFIDSLEGNDKQLILDKFVRKKSFENIALNHGVDRKAIWRQINELLLKPTKN